MERPLVWIALALVAGTLAAAYGLCPGLAPPLAIFMGAASLPLLMSRRPYIVSISLCVAFVGIGALLWNVRHSRQIGDILSRYVVAYPEEQYVLEGRVERSGLVLGDTEYTSFVLHVDHMRSDKLDSEVSAKVSVRWSKPETQLFYSERVRVSGALELNLGKVNPGLGGVEDYLRRHDIHTCVKVRGTLGVERIGPGRRWHPAYWASRLRAYEAERLWRAMPAKTFDFIVTVLLGDRSRLSDEDYRNYVKSGTAHILAVSGIHTGLIFAATAYVLRLLTHRRKVRALVTMVVVLLFAMVAGARISVVRASVMIVAYLMADLFDREPDTPTALSFSAIVFLLSDPDVLFDTGFLLSFLSVSSILIFSDRATLLFGDNQSFAAKFAAPTLAVQILPLPLMIHFFHIYPIIAPLTNLIIIPLLGVTLCLGFLCGGAALVFPPAAPLFGYACWPSVRLIESIAGAGAQCWGSHVYVTSPTRISMACYWLAIGALLLALGKYDRSPRARRMASVPPLPKAWRGFGLGTILLKVFLPSVAARQIGDEGWRPDREAPRFLTRPRIFAAAAIVLGGLSLACWSPWRQEARVVFLDVGHGDSAFVLTPGGTRLLIDGGDRNPRYDAGARIVAPFLWANHVARLDYVLVSHAHMDHIGGVSEVIRRFPVGAVLLSAGHSSSKAEEELIALCEQRGVAVRRLEAGQKIALDGGELEVLHPPGDWPTGEENDRSMIVRLTWPGLDVLFTGDIEAKAEGALATAVLKTDVLKTPHHGSRTSSSTQFVTAVSPRYAVVSTGGSGKREGVDEEVLERYSAAGSEVLRTDYLGAITLKSVNGVLSAVGERDTRGYPHH